MPLNREEAIALLKVTVRTDRRHVDYKRVCELAKRYTKYATGEDIGSLLKKFGKRESDDAFKQREDITSITVPDHVNTLVSPMYKVGRTTANETMKWSSVEKQEQNRKLLTKAMEKFYGDQSLNDYLTMRMVDLDKIDCNSFIVTEFKGVVDPSKPDSKAKPYPFEVNATEAIDYKYINNELQYLTVYQEKLDKFTIYIENDAISAVLVDKEVLKAMIAKDSSIEFFYKDESNKENSPVYILSISEHKAGRIPARRVGTVKDPLTRYRTCLPMIHPAESYFKKAIKTVSEFDLTNALHVFPKVFRYDNPCKGDVTNGDICNDGKDASGATCKHCNGTGWKAQTSTADEVIIRMPKETKDMVSLENMMAYKSPSIDLIKFQKEYGLNDLKELAIRAVYNGDTFIRDSVQQTATEATLNYESVYDTLKPFADSWAAMKKHIVECIAAYIDLNNDGFEYYYAFPKDFKMKPLSVLLDDLKKANDSGVPSYAKKSIVHDIYKKIYVDSPDQLLKLQTKEKYFPFNGKTESEINYILANGIVTKKDRVLYAKFDTIFDECEAEVQSGIDFYRLDAAKQRDMINKKVEAYVTELDNEESASIGNAFNSGSNGEEGRSILGNEQEIEKNIAERKQQEINNGNTQGNK